MALRDLSGLHKPLILFSTKRTASAVQCLGGKKSTALYASCLPTYAGFHAFEQDTRKIRPGSTQAGTASTTVRYVTIPPRYYRNDCITDDINHISTFGYMLTLPSPVYSQHLQLALPMLLLTTALRLHSHCWSVTRCIYLLPFAQPPEGQRQPFGAPFQPPSADQQTSWRLQPLVPWPPQPLPSLP